MVVDHIHIAGGIGIGVGIGTRIGVVMVVVIVLDMLSSIQPFVLPTCLSISILRSLQCTSA